MIELSISKADGEQAERPFSVRALYYDPVPIDIRMGRRTTVMSGEYIDSTHRLLTIEVKSALELMEAYGLTNNNIIVFNNIIIDREVPDERIKALNSITELLGLHVELKETDISNVMEQISLFRIALDILRNNEKVNEMLPVQVNEIAFIVESGTEEDMVLSHEATLLGHLDNIQTYDLNVYYLEDKSDDEDEEEN